MINQREIYLTTNAFKCCLSNFLNFSRKQENAQENRRSDLSTVSNNLESIFTTWTLPEITTIFNSRLSVYVLPFKMNTETMQHLEAMKSLIKYNKDENPASGSKCYETLSKTKNVKSSSPIKLELETREIQRQQSRDLFETLQQLNMMKTQECTKDAVKPSAFSKIGTEAPRI